MRLVVALLLAAFPAGAFAAPFFGQKGQTFPLGTRAFELDAAYIHPVRFSDDQFYGVNAAGHYYFGDEVSVGVGVEGYFVDQVRDDTVLAGASVMMRWHFLAADRYSLFFDAGVGVSYAGMDVPEMGTHFNYTPRIGGGATLKLREDLHLLAGVRFFHLSNGNLNGRNQNPSQDGAQYYVGVLITL